MFSLALEWSALYIYIAVIYTAVIYTVVIYIYSNIYYIISKEDEKRMKHRHRNMSLTTLQHPKTLTRRMRRVMTRRMTRKMTSRMTRRMGSRMTRRMITGF